MSEGLMTGDRASDMLIVPNSLRCEGPLSATPGRRRDSLARRRHAGPSCTLSRLFLVRPFLRSYGNGETAMAERQRKAGNQALLALQLCR